MARTYTARRASLRTAAFISSCRSRHFRPVVSLARIPQVFGTLCPIYPRADNRTPSWVVSAAVGGCFLIAENLFEGDRAANPKERRNRCIAKRPTFFLRPALLG